MEVESLKQENQGQKKEIEDLKDKVNKFFELVKSPIAENSNPVAGQNSSSATPLNKQPRSGNIGQLFPFPRSKSLRKDEMEVDVSNSSQFTLR